MPEAPDAAEEPLEGCQQLFSNEEYEERAVSVGQRAIRLLSLTAATTLLLARFLAEHLRGQRYAACCELGAGVGLPGLIAAQSCPAVLTDHSPTVLRVLRRNVALNHAGGPPVRCLQLEWASPQDRRAVLECSPQGQGFELLIAADVCYGLNALAPLFSCAHALLARASHAAFYLGYVSRWASVDRAVVPAAEAAGFAVGEVPLVAGLAASVPAGKVYRLVRRQ